MTAPGRVALITGGGTGIGAAIARQLSADGCAIAIAGRRREPLDALAQELERNGRVVLPLVADLSERSAPAKLVEQVTSRFARLDVVVNNAAVLQYGLLADITADVFDDHVAVNVRAPLLLVKEAVPWLKQSEAGRVLNIASASARLSIPGQAVYGMTKAALEYLTRMWASELAPSRVCVNAISPGPVDTPIHHAWSDDPAAVTKALSGATPLGLVAAPAEIARWAGLLCSKDSTYVTGAVLRLDGGQTLNGWSSNWAAATRSD